jgi:hypothetical protein
MVPSDADLHHVRFVDYAGFAMGPGERRQPQWLRVGGLCFVGCWEVMAWRRYSGIATTWADADYAFECSQAFIDDISKLGCNAVVVPYDCGHGEACNEREVQRTKAFIALAQQQGLRVGTYFRPDIVWTETLSQAELEELAGAFQVDAQGRLVQPFGAAAVNVCYHHAGARARLLRHIKRAISELHSDMLHLDGLIVGGAEGSGACRCPNCVADFRRFLVGRYGADRDAAARRFGHPYLEQMVPPANYPTNSAPFDSGPVQPHWAEWVAFRCTWTSRLLAEVAQCARELNPEVAIEVNNALPAVREPAALFLGTDVIGIGHYTDASWSEDGYPPALLPDGKLIQRVRQFKLCRAAGTFALTYMDQADERRLRQNLAHTAAFNLGHIGCIGFPPHMNFSNRYTVHFQTKCAFMGWLKAQRQYFCGLRSAATLAVWRPRENMAMSGRMAYAATMRMEQLLIESCLGFDLAFDEDPRALARYAVVMVPNVECMSLEQITGLINYVRRGGSLLVGQDSALFDLWHRRRIENPWAPLFGDATAKNVVADAVAVGAAGVFVEARTASVGDALARVEYGKGRAVYAPQIVDPASQPSLMTADGALNTALDYTNWVVPDAAAEITAAVDWLQAGRLRWQVDAGRGMLAEFLTQESPSRTLLHLVNLCPEPQRHCAVTIDAPAAGEIAVLHPPTDLAPRWRVERTHRRTQVIFDFLDVYVVVVVPGE